MTVITQYGNHRIEAESWAMATHDIARLQSEQAHHAALVDYREDFELIELNFQNEELSS